MTGSFQPPGGIAALLNIADPGSRITGVSQEGDAVFVDIERIETAAYCGCGRRMQSKGIRLRSVNHPVLQDGRAVTLRLKVRKWHCPECGAYSCDSYPFVEAFKRNTTLAEIMVLDKMKDPGRTCASIASDMHTSDTYVHDVFMKWVDLPRLPLCKVLLFDEVYLKTSQDELYACVLMDWETGEVIDILPNRFKSTIGKYLRQIPLKERDAVEYVVSDMYETYSSLAGTYFRKAVSVIDTFHHTQPLIQGITSYINNVKKRYKARDLAEYEKLRAEGRTPPCKFSRETRLLEKFSWMITKNSRDIDYSPRWVEPANRSPFLYNPRAKEAELFALDPNFKKIHELKEKYVQFTADPALRNNRGKAAEELDALIKEYSGCGIALFKTFAGTLQSHREGIINSFIYLPAVRSDGEAPRRISTGPLESFNNMPKDVKRISNGIKNFNYVRNRLLWANRKNPPILGVPKTPAERHAEGKKRGPYKKGGKADDHKD